jgi:peptide/nickel transport system substrate-binding protein
MYSAFVGRKSDHKWYLWEDGEADALVAQSTIVGDAARRQALFDQLHQKMIDWTPVIGVFSSPELTANRRNIQGIETWTLGFARYWGVWRGQ